MPREQITSFQNAKVKQIRKLRNRRQRDLDQRFVIDDGRDLERALDCGYQVDYAFYCPELSNGDEQLLERISDVHVYEVSAEIMQKASYRQNPSALLAVMVQKSTRGAADLGRIADAPILALVDLRKPGNIGALLRTADAAGIKTILLVDTALDIYNPNVIRSSTGACFLNNIYVLATCQALAFFKDRGYQIVAAAVDGEQTLFEVVFPAKVALVLGTEDRGLDEAWLQAADQRVRIPMLGELSDSLNVSVSGALFMYEVLRQRLSSTKN